MKQNAYLPFIFKWLLWKQLTIRKKLFEQSATMRALIHAPIAHLTERRASNAKEEGSRPRRALM